MKAAVNDFAAFGGRPAFSRPLHVAQINLPPWHELETTFRGIFERRYFANHGPLVRELDARVASHVGARHAVCVTNGTVALMILAAALELEGEVIVPAFTFPATAQAISWAGLTPVLCDVDPVTHMVTEATIAPHITPRTSAIMAVHLWGKPCAPARLEEFAEAHGLKLVFDACHAFGGISDGRPIGTFGTGEAFSFHATKVLGAGEGGCITTNDDEFAARLRTIRSFHPSETFSSVRMRMNGKMSEAQAGMALLGLDHLPEYIAANRRRHEAFRSGLTGIPGVSLLEYSPEERNSYQYVVLEIDSADSGLERDSFLEILTCENVICRRHFYPGLHRVAPFSSAVKDAAGYPGTDHLCARLLQLPNSQQMTEDDVGRMCGLIRSIQQHAPAILRARGNEARP